MQLNGYKLELIFMILLFGLILAIIYGYCMNVFLLVKCDFEPPYKSEIIRTIGVVTGLGIIFGYIEIDDTRKYVYNDEKTVIKTVK